jgi:acetoin utilization deacetylase AcuC-like enzyme
MMDGLYHDPVFLHHDPGHHPEHPGRLIACWNRLSRGSTLPLYHVRPAPLADIESLLAVHDAGVVDRARITSERGGYLDADTPVGRESYHVALRAAGAAMAAVDDVIAGDSSKVFCLLRPPGHHATRQSSMGFCLFNNIAIAARHATTRHQLDRVLIVDWDVHHGNGTQDIFYDDPSVYFLSLHRYPFYPGTGGAGESGTGRGLGSTRNLPLSLDLDGETILDRFRSSLEDAARSIRPQLVLISAGFDGHHLDPIGGLRLDEEHFQAMTRMVLDVAREYAGGKVVSLLEGGYHPEVLARCVEDHLRLLCRDGAE